MIGRAVVRCEQRDIDRYKRIVAVCYVEAADAIRTKFNCCVVIVHHCGIEGSRPRGHTSLSGAADGQIAISKAEDGSATATVELMKDGPEGDAIGFRLEQIELGPDPDGDLITSCFVAEAEAAPPTLKARKLTARQKQAMDALRNSLIDQGQAPPSCSLLDLNSRELIVEAHLRRRCRASVLEQFNNR